MMKEVILCEKAYFLSGQTITISIHAIIIIMKKLYVVAILQKVLSRRPVESAKCLLIDFFSLLCSTIFESIDDNILTP